MRPIRNRPDFNPGAAACSLLAMGTALAMAAPAQAQSFQAGSTVAFGSANVATGTGTTTITVDTPSAVIDWSPNDTAVNNGVPIAFQPNGTTATFTNGANTANFAVLNRIVPVDPTRPVVFDGTVISQLQDFTGSNPPVPGGTVFFYSPGGILLGANATFDVGNLGLTSAEPLVDGNGNWYINDTVQFQQADSDSLVALQGGAQVQASATNSYVALVSPSVQNAGTIDVNGAAALVGAEAATVRFSPDGLFDIQITVGSGSQAVGNNDPAVFNTGTITGPVGTAGVDHHRAYFVTVPKNAMIADLIIAPGSSVGYDVAGAADTVGNAVILSLGYDVVGGEIVPTASNSTGTGLVRVDSANITSRIESRSSGLTQFDAANGDATFASDVSLTGPNVGMTAFTGNTLTIAGMFDIDVGFGALGNTAQGGFAQVAADGGTITINNNVFINANGIGTTATMAGQTAGSSTGGLGRVAARNGGSLSITGDLLIQADGISGGTLDPGAFGGDGTGGIANIHAFDGNASIQIDGDVILSASGFGRTSGGAGTGGQAEINSISGGNNSIFVGGTTFVSASGTGGDSNLPGTAAGAGTGGTATVIVNDASTVQLQETSIFASGLGGQHLAGGTGGSAMGGTAQVIGSGGTISAGFVEVVASAGGGGADGQSGSAEGGQALVLADGGAIALTGNLSADSGGFGASGGVGGSGQGGTSTIEARGNINSSSSIVAMDVTASAGGIGGAGGNALTAATAGGAGGSGTGGFAGVLGNAGNGTIDFQNTEASAIGIGRNGGAGMGATGGAGGSGTGGFAQVGTISGPDTPTNTGSATYASLLATAEAFGGEGGMGTGGGSGGNGGSASSGGAVLLARGTPVQITGMTEVNADALGGNGGAGATAGLGGSANVGGIAVLVSNRFQFPTQRGSLDTPTLIGSARGTGGTGMTTGATSILDRPVLFEIANGDVSIGVVDLAVVGNTLTQSLPSLIDLTGSIVTIDDAFTFDSTGDLTLDLDNSTLNADAVSLFARNYILPAAPPAVAGLITTNDLDLFSAPGGNIVTYAGFNIPSSVSFTVDGNFRTGPFTAAGTFFSRSLTGSVTHGAISATDIEVQAATVANVNGVWSAPSIQVTSNDISIAANGGIAAGPSGLARVLSSNLAGAFLGDGLSGSGYALSNAEFGRISGFEIEFGSLDNPMQPVDLTIGNLDISASQVLSSSGSVFLASGDANFLMASGGIRVTGTITGSGFALTNSLDIATGRFELDAATGGIFLSNGTGQLGGTLGISAAQIHIADSALLTQLAQDPAFPGYFAAINAPATVQRPDGVLVAQGIFAFPEETLYIQNTGTAAVPAGFVSVQDESEIVPPDVAPAGGLRVVFNGQFDDNGQRIAGVEAYNRFVAENDTTTGINPDSTFNGCALAPGTCFTAAESDPVRAISSEIRLIQQDTLQEEPFVDEGEEQDESEADAAKAPIAPPAPLIDTRPLNPPLDVTEPVSGAGNPALIGSAVNEAMPAGENQ